MVTTTLAVAGGRAALIGGLAPLLLLAGVLLLVMAAPGSKDRILELKDRLQRVSSALPEPVRAYLGADTGAGQEQDEPESGWKTSDPQQFSEFFKQLEDDDPEGDAERPY